MEELSRLTAFVGERRIASGDPLTVARAARGALAGNGSGRVVVFDDATGRVVGVDLQATPAAIAASIAAARAAGAGSVEAGPKGPGRPRLGVVAKEVTLLPRHWAWLGAQRGGASATLRRLVDEARKRYERRDRVRRAQDATYRFLSVTVGDHPGFEEAIRALYAGDRARFWIESDAWPTDLRGYAREQAEPAFDEPTHRTDEPDEGRTNGT